MVLKGVFLSVRGSQWLSELCVAIVKYRQTLNKCKYTIIKSLEVILSYLSRLNTKLIKILYKLYIFKFSINSAHRVVVFSVIVESTAGVDVDLAAIVSVSVDACPLLLPHASSVPILLVL